MNAYDIELDGKEQLEDGSCVFKPYGGDIFTIIMYDMNCVHVEGHYFDLEEAERKLLTMAKEFVDGGKIVKGVAGFSYRHKLINYAQKAGLDTMAHDIAVYDKDGKLVWNICIRHSCIKKCTKGEFEWTLNK